MGRLTKDLLYSKRSLGGGLNHIFWHNSSREELLPFLFQWESFPTSFLIDIDATDRGFKIGV